MRICLFGGTGFLGRHFVAENARVPGREIRVVTRHPDRHPSSPNLAYVSGDLLSPATLIDAIGAGDTVVNLAYLQGRPAEENFQAADNLVRAALQRGVSQVLHCSTAVVVGRSSQDVITESSPAHPLTEYERVKLEIERRILSGLRGRIRTLVVRPTAIIGEGGSNLVAQIESLKRDTVLAQRLKLFLFAGRTMNLVCVENVVSAIEFLLSSPPSLDQETFIVSDDDSPQNTYPEVMRILAGRARVWSSTRLRHRFLFWSLMTLMGRSDTNLTRRYSSAKLKAQGWVPRVDFVAGLRGVARSAGLVV